VRYYILITTKLELLESIQNMDHKILMKQFVLLNSQKIKELQYREELEGIINTLAVIHDGFHLLNPGFPDPVSCIQYEGQE